MSREYWQERAYRLPTEQQHAVDYVAQPYDATSSVAYDQQLYSHEGPAYHTIQHYAAVPYDRGATYSDHRQADIVVSQPGPSYVQEAAYDYGVQDGNGGQRSGLSNGASERSTFTLPANGAQYAWHAVQQQRPPQIDAGIQLPLTPVTAVPSSKVDLEGAARASAAGKERKKASTVTRKCRPASCTPCRTRKMRCSRSKPCTACVNRGDPEGCLWEG